MSIMNVFVALTFFQNKKLCHYNYMKLPQLSLYPIRSAIAVPTVRMHNAVSRSPHVHE